MTTLTFTNANANSNSFATSRSPRQSFAGRLAVLQARQEQAPHLSDMFAIGARFALAAVPVSAMAWLFFFV